MRRAILVSLGGLGLLVCAAHLAAAVTLTDVVVPQYVEAANSATRIPAVYRVTIAGLTPGATYRYFMQAVSATDAATVSGAGNSFFLDATGSFYTSGPAMTTVGSTCSQFTADGSGNYTGWMGLVSTGNSRFTAGNTVYLRVMLNDGAGGTSVATRVTTSAGSTAVGFGTTTSDATGVFQSTSAFAARDVVLLYDDASGSGRPVSTAIVQDDGVTLPSAVAFYANSVDAGTGAWGTLIPNALAAGVRRIEQCSNTTGAVVQALTDPDGVWSPGALSTVAPAGGTAAIDLTGVVSEAPVPTQHRTFGQLKATYR